MSTVPEPRGIRCADIMHEPGETLTRDLVLSQYTQCSQRARPFIGRPIGRRPGQVRPLRKQPRPIQAEFKRPTKAYQAWQAPIGPVIRARDRLLQGYLDSPASFNFLGFYFFPFYLRLFLHRQSHHEPSDNISFPGHQHNPILRFFSPTLHFFFSNNYIKSPS